MKTDVCVWILFNGHMYIQQSIPAAHRPFLEPDFYVLGKLDISLLMKFVL